MPLWFPDSRSLLVYSYDAKLRRLDVETGEVHALPADAKVPNYQDGANTAGRGTSLLLAPDGRSVYYLARDREASATRFVRRALEGGPETEVCRIRTDAVLGFSISPDGGRLVFVSGGAVWTVPTSGGTPKEFYRAPTVWSYPSKPWPHQPVWSKDGQHLFVIFSWDGGDVFAFPREGGEPKPLGFGLHQKACLDLSPDGSQLVFADEQWSNQLWMIKNLFPEAKPAR